VADAGEPELSGAITDAIGDGWMTDLDQLSKLKPLINDTGFRDAVRRAKRDAKCKFADWLKFTHDERIDPDTIVDCQIERIHEYKQQLLNALRIIILYSRLRENPALGIPPRIFFFAGKAAPAYRLAKLIIKFLNNLAGTVDGDPVTRGRLKVVFLPDYNVSLAERLIPAADVSNQISTAGYEASGTSNMKFMMNGALTLGTRDGATIEMAQEAGEENFFLFGLTAQQLPIAPPGTTRTGITTTSRRLGPHWTLSPLIISAATSPALLCLFMTRCSLRATTTCTWRMSDLISRRIRGSVSSTPTGKDGRARRF
jgi:glycogen phosphorylase